MSRILFLYATNNSGHQKAAEAIQESLRQIAPRVDTSQLDFFTSNYPVLGRFIFKMYIEVMQSIPHAYNYLYDNPQLAQMTAELRQFFSILNVPRLHKVLREYRPHAIVCTQAIPAGFLSLEKGKGTIDIPLLATITDFVANPYWPDRHINCYFVPNDEIKKQLVQRHIPSERIQVTGIPVNAAFHHQSPQLRIRTQLGLRSDLPTVLIMGGSHGLGRIHEAVAGLRASNARLQMIIVTGHNRMLYRTLKKHFMHDESMLILSVVKNIASLMDAADLLISKPGGLTSAEAMAKGLPMLILSPLPGQEERNAAYLVHNGIGERCDDTADLPHMVNNLLHHPQKLKRYA
jgi:processive 1,2-diacylglycerol beta-glucosyltransferase